MWKEIARPGKFGSAGTEVTEKDLQEVAETFQGDVPVAVMGKVTIGHQLADFMPALGWVKKVIWDPAKKVLFGDVELNDPLKSAEAEGFFKKWSAGIRTLADSGKKYLHHLAYLGATPPAIRDLENAFGNMVNLADAGETWTFGDDPPQTQNPSKETKVEKTPEQIAAEAAAAAQAAAAQKQDDDVKNLSDDLKGAKDELATMRAELRKGKITALKTAMAGRIPAAKHADVIALADSLPMQDTIELADDKGVKSKKSPIDLLIDIVGAIAMPVQAGRMNLGDPPAGQSDAKPIDMRKMLTCV